MPDTHPKLQFTSDYMEGAHPSILEALVQTNLQQTEGYGFDPSAMPPRRSSAMPAGARTPKFTFW